MVGQRDPVFLGKEGSPHGLVIGNDGLDRQKAKEPGTLVTEPRAGNVASDRGTDTGEWAPIEDLPAGVRRLEGRRETGRAAKQAQKKAPSAPWMTVSTGTT